MKYQEIKEKRGKDINELYNTCGVFWAFSNEQFEDGYKKVKETMSEGEKLVSIGAGGYLPKHNVEALIKGQKEIEETFKNTIAETKAREEHILYELNNHEAFYTGEIEDTLNALGEDYTAEEVSKVYKENFKNEIKNY